MRGLQEYITLILRCPLQCQDVEILAGLWADFVVSSRQNARSKERFRMQDRVNGQHDVGRGWVKGQRLKSLMVSYGSCCSNKKNNHCFPHHNMCAAPFASALLKYYDNKDMWRTRQMRRRQPHVGT